MKIESSGKTFRISKSRVMFNTWNISKVSEASIDTKLSQSQNVVLEKGDQIVEYSSKIAILV